MSKYSLLKKYINILKDSLYEQFINDEPDKNILLYRLVDSRTKFFIEKQKEGFAYVQYETAKNSLKSKFQYSGSNRYAKGKKYMNI